MFLLRDVRFPRLARRHANVAGEIDFVSEANQQCNR